MEIIKDVEKAVKTLVYAHKHKDVYALNYACDVLDYCSRSKDFNAVFKHFASLHGSRKQKTFFNQNKMTTEEEKTELLKMLERSISNILKQKKEN